MCLSAYVPCVCACVSMCTEEEAEEKKRILVVWVSAPQRPVANS